MTLLHLKLLNTYCFTETEIIRSVDTHWDPLFGSTSSSWPLPINIRQSLDHLRMTNDMKLKPMDHQLYSLPFSTFT